MKVREIMTENPQCGSPADSVRQAAQWMADCDCGEIPVLDEQGRPVGVLTDRDICCRVVAQGLDPTATQISEIMSSPVITVSPEEDLDTCCQLMDDNQIRRIPVVDDAGVCCGIVAQADIARATEDSLVGHIVRDISRPAGRATQLNP